MNTETRFYFLLSFDESYSLYATNATGFKNNIRAETALCSGTTDNLQTFLKYPFPFCCQSLSSMQAGQLNHFLLMNHYTRKVSFKFLMRNCCIRIIKHELVLWIFIWNWYATFFLSLNAHSLIQFCLLCFEADVWSSTFGSKACDFFFPVWCGVFKLFCFLHTCSKENKTHHHFDLMGVKSVLNLDTCFCRWGPSVWLVCKLSGKLLCMQHKLKGSGPKFWSLCILSICPVQKGVPRGTWGRLFCLIWVFFHVLCTDWLFLTHTLTRISHWLWKGCYCDNY